MDVSSPVRGVLRVLESAVSVLEAALPATVTFSVSLPPVMVLSHFYCNLVPDLVKLTKSY